MILRENQAPLPSRRLMIAIQYNSHKSVLYELRTCLSLQVLMRIYVIQTKQINESDADLLVLNFTEFSVIYMSMISDEALVSTMNDSRMDSTNLKVQKSPNLPRKMTTTDTIDLNIQRI